MPIGSRGGCHAAACCACCAPQIYKERKHLAFTLADAKSVVARLEFLLGVAAHAVAALLYLLIFRVGVL